MQVIFTHLKLWVAVARHNFKWVKNKMYNLARQRLTYEGPEQIFYISLTFASRLRDAQLQVSENFIF